MKSWDKNWEKTFRNKEWGKYPPEELIRFIARNYYSVSQRSKIKILDLGCGTGAAVWYMARKGFAVAGVDGSKTAIKIARQRFREEKFKADLRIGDVIKLDYSDRYFDAVTDIACIQCNFQLSNVKKIISEVYRVLKPGGKFFGTMIAKGIEDWPKQSHFFKRDEIRRLFSGFSNLKIEYVIRSHHKAEKLWLVEAVK